MLGSREREGEGGEGRGNVPPASSAEVRGSREREEEGMPVPHIRVLLPYICKDTIMCCPQVCHRKHVLP